MIRFPYWLTTCIAAADSRETESVVTEFRNVPEGWLGLGGMALLAALLWGVVWMYRREGRIGASPRVRMFLAGVRCTIFVILAAILLEPVSVRILRRWVDSYTIVLVDDSSSMDLADRYRDEGAGRRVRTVIGNDTLPMPRRRIVEKLFAAADRKLLRDLTQNNRVKLYTFADDARLVATLRAAHETPSPQTAPAAGAAALSDPAESPLEFPATGARTNLERAVRRSVESLGSAPIAAVIAFTDGGINDGASAEQIARYARERRLPIHVVGLGDPAPPRNVRVTEVLAPENVFQADPFAVTATVGTEGLEGETVRVQLRERHADDSAEARIVDSRDVFVGFSGAGATLTFQRRQERVGRYLYTVEAAAVADESVVEDNARQATVNIIDARTKVLLIAGGPSWDYRYVTTLLQRDDTIEVSCWLQSADVSAVRDGDAVIDHLPATAEELFEYDVILLMDPDKEELDEDWCRLVDTLVSEHGGGLLLAAARPHTPEFLRERALKPIHDLLPVSLDPEADLLLNQIGHYQTSASPLDIPVSAYAHPILRLSDDAVATKLAWQGIGDVYWHLPVLREKPVATVLFRHGNARMRNAFGGHVLAAVQFVGAGRTGFLGFDGTWRWRRFGEQVYDRFWVQMVRYLSQGKLLGGSKRATLIVENEHPALGEAVNVSARLLDARYEPMVRTEVVAQYRVDDQRVDFVLTPKSDRPGWYDGRFVPDRVGAYRVRVSAPGGSGGAIEAEREVLVSRPNLELARPQMNKAELTLLAEQSNGGRFWEVDEAANLPAAIPDLHEEVPVRSRPKTLWDNGTTLSLLVILLAIEWALRKWNRLL